MSDVLVRYADFRKTIAGMFSTVTQTMVDAALHYANKYLEGQTRYDGTPMLDHAVAVARIVATEVGLGRNSTVSAIIHDVVRLAAKSEKSFDECRDSAGKMYSLCEENLTGFDTVKAFGLEKSQNERYGKITSDYSKWAHLGYLAAGKVQPIVAFINNIAYFLFFSIRC